MIRLIEITGQSNAAGRADVATELPAELTGYLNNVFLWNGTDFVRMNVTTSTVWNMDDLFTGKFGIQPFFERLGAAMPEDEVYIVHNARGATGIAPSMNEWYAGGSTFTDWTTSLIDMAAWFDTRDLDWEITHRIWIQGSADAQTTELGNAYAANLDDFKRASEIRYQAVQGSVPKWIGMPMVDSSADRPGLAAVAAATTAAATLYDNWENISNSGLSYADDPPIHFDAASYEIMAERIMDIIASDWGLYTSFT